jgi:hypothetical protein
MRSASSIAGQKVVSQYNGVAITSRMSGLANYPDFNGHNLSSGSLRLIPAKQIILAPFFNLLGRGLASMRDQFAAVVHEHSCSLGCHGMYPLKLNGSVSEL